MRRTEDKRKITLDKLDMFLSGRQVLEECYLRAEHPDGTPKVPYKLGLLSSTIAEFADTVDYTRNIELLKTMNSLCKEGSKVYLAGDGAYVLNTYLGNIRFFRLSEMQQGKDILQRLYFETQTNKPHNNTLRLLAKKPNVELFDYVTGLADIYHWEGDSIEGITNSWMETDFGKGEKATKYVIDMNLKIAMPRSDYYALFVSKVYSRIKGSEIAADMQIPEVKKAILAENNLPYIFCREELIKKLTNGQFGE